MKQRFDNAKKDFNDPGVAFHRQIVFLIIVLPYYFSSFIAFFAIELKFSIDCHGFVLYQFLNKPSR